MLLLIKALSTLITIFLNYVYNIFKNKALLPQITQSCRFILLK